MIRKLILAAAALVCAATMWAGTPVSPSEIPSPVKKFISAHYASEKIRKAEKDYDHGRYEYEIDFVSGAEIEIAADGSWIEMKAAYGAAVPAKAVPAAVSAYVSKNFSGSQIVELKKKRYGYKVELSNGTELKLSNDGTPVR